MGTSLCCTWTTSTSGGAPDGAPETPFGRTAPITRPTITRKTAPPIQNLYFEIVLIFSPRRSRCSIPSLACKQTHHPDSQTADCVSAAPSLCGRPAPLPKGIILILYFVYDK